MDNHVFLNIEGVPVTKDSMYLSHGHGYYAYISNVDSFIYNLFKDICLWSGPTDRHETINGDVYIQFELNCRDKDFFKSIAFKKICHNHNVELTIFDNGDDKQIIQNFWRQIKPKRISY